MQMLTAGLGTVGYAMLCQVKWKKLPYIFVGDCVVWLVYSQAMALWNNLFLCNVLGAMCATIFAEVLARLLKAPSTTFLMPILMPLAPGGGLYYTVYYAMTGQAALRQHWLGITFYTCCGLVAGITLVTFLFQCWYSLVEEKRLHSGQG